ncbi:hypothetical protein MSIBF_A4120002 [groundwater metagenome]|uniref:Uncharacterized protein n=1 Tax=groundwater metagenome TaxID=717931 RepID=A0A098EDF0_9ZZZZ
MKDVIKFFEKSSEHHVKMERMLQEEKILIEFGFTGASIYLCSKELKLNNKDEKVIVKTSDGELYNFLRNYSEV